MKFHHMMITVSNMDEAIRLWRDIMGFDLVYDGYLPDGKEKGPTCVMYPELLDAIFHTKDAKARCVLFQHKGGAMLEIQEPVNPAITITPKEKLKYGNTGVRELGLFVKDIDGFYKKIKEAGYEMQTDYVWDCATMGRSFLFFDYDGNMIQLWEADGEPSWV